MKIENWEKALADEIESARAQAFEYGSFDCLIFAARCVKATTGEDRLAQLLTYKSKLEALKLIATYGSIENGLSSILGAPKHAAFAKRGDICLFEIDEGEEPGGFGIGVCEGLRSWMPSEKGLAFRPTLSALHAWTID